MVDRLAEGAAPRSRRSPAAGRAAASDRVTTSAAARVRGRYTEGIGTLTWAGLPNCGVLAPPPDSKTKNWLFVWS